MGVENLEEMLMPMALIRVANLIEEDGYIALPQRKSPLILNEEDTTNPEVDYTDVYHGVKAENQLDFLNCAVQCGLGEKSKIGSLLTKEYGPFIRYCFILTDMELEATPMQEYSLCDGCNECIKACPGCAIKENGETNIWAVARYNLPGLVAHQSALKGGVVMDVPDLGNPPADWEVLDYRTMK